MGIYVKFTITIHLKYRKFLFSPNSVLNFRKVTKFGRNWLKNKKLQAKNKLGGGKRPSPVLIGLI